MKRGEDLERFAFDRSVRRTLFVFGSTWATSFATSVQVTLVAERSSTDRSLPLRTTTTTSTPSRFTPTLSETSPTTKASSSRSGAVLLDELYLLVERYSLGFGLAGEHLLPHLLSRVCHRKRKSSLTIIQLATVSSRSSMDP